MSIEKNPEIISFNELRRAIGWLGIILPVVLSVLLFTMNGCAIQDSISQYFYTRMGSYLTGTLCAVGLFLLAYRGYPGDTDGRLCNFAGACAFGIAFIPMQLDPKDVCCPECIVKFTDGHAWFRFMHFVSAGLFFLTLAYISYFKFTKTNKTIIKGDKKHKRNLVYKNCGIIIFSCIIILAVYNANKNWGTGLDIDKLTFFMESIMLFAFGTAWLVKGEGVKMLNDKKKDKAEKHMISEVGQGKIENLASSITPDIKTTN